MPAARPVYRGRAQALRRGYRWPTTAPASHPGCCRRSSGPPRTRRPYGQNRRESVGSESAGQANGTITTKERYPRDRQALRGSLTIARLEGLEHRLHNTAHRGTTKTPTSTTSPTRRPQDLQRRGGRSRGRGERGEKRRDRGRQGGEGDDLRRGGRREGGKRRGGVGERDGGTRGEEGGGGEREGGEGTANPDGEGGGQPTPGGPRTGREPRGGGRGGGGDGREAAPSTRRRLSGERGGGEKRKEGRGEKGGDGDAEGGERGGERSAGRRRGGGGPEGRDGGGERGGRGTGRGRGRGPGKGEKRRGGGRGEEGGEREAKEGDEGGGGGGRRASQTRGEGGQEAGGREGPRAPIALPLQLGWGRGRGGTGRRGEGTEDHVLRINGDLTSRGAASRDGRHGPGGGGGRGGGGGGGGPRRGGGEGGGRGGRETGPVLRINGDLVARGRLPQCQPDTGDMIANPACAARPQGDNVSREQSWGSSGLATNRPRRLILDGGQLGGGVIRRTIAPALCHWTSHQRQCSPVQSEGVGLVEPLLDHPYVSIGQVVEAGIDVVDHGIGESVWRAPDRQHVKEPGHRVANGLVVAGHGLV